MITRTLLLLIATLTSASALSNENVNQQLDVAPGGKLVVEVDFGTVDVAAGANDKVSVEATRQIDCRDEAKEKEYIAAAPITVGKEGNTVTIRARRQPRENSWSWGGHTNMDARYTVQVPRNFNIDLRTGGGTIIANDLAGEIVAHTSGGKLKFAHLQGPITAKTSGGNIELNACEGPLKVNTSGGHIDSVDGKGTLDARTSGGSVVVRNFEGDTDVATSGGSLSLVNLNGKITGKTSGGSIAASLRTAVSGDLDLHTSSGSIELAVPPDAAFNIDAHASVGRVNTELPFVGTRTDGDHLKGQINGGGKSVVLRSGAGSIIIKPAFREIVQR
ncbi:MAG: DUF4097 family beta strand repeat-containing protein [Chthoniobacterales bacterium]